MHLKTLLKRPAITTGASTPMATARDLMRRHGVQHLPVLRRRGLVGLLTERDVKATGPSTVRQIRAHDWEPLLDTLTVGDVMSREPLALAPETSVAQAARLARARRAEALVVVDGGEVVGVVTRSDLLAVLGGLLEHRHPTGLGHVLVATSLRAGSSVALAEALRIAVADGAPLTALHVQARVGRLATVEGATAKDVAWVERTRRRIAYEAMAALCRAGQAHEVTCEVTDGPIAREIARRAAELDSDLIVVGKTIPRGPFALMGETVADRLAREAPCPVLAVPRNARRVDARR